MHATSLQGQQVSFKRLDCGNQADIGSASNHDQFIDNIHCNVKMQLGNVGHIEEDNLYFDPYISLWMPKFHVVCSSIAYNMVLPDVCYTWWGMVLAACISCSTDCSIVCLTAAQRVASASCWCTGSHTYAASRSASRISLILLRGGSKHCPPPNTLGILVCLLLHQFPSIATESRLEAILLNKPAELCVHEAFPRRSNALTYMKGTSTAPLRPIDCKSYKAEQGCQQNEE
jgi:hypothetical protein